ncbi:MAG: DNA replication/repair protein RecF [Fimbriimonadaceae bacterium]|nr:DNA replication/repair protein RecF [Fimbriimonadaceae bacterium]QYK57151.1 MAG: DNA replication/repair protein RecF [Fimbriimonadaceae bacterium]
MPVLRRLALERFRNYSFIDLSPEPTMNIVCGPNGNGKTNLLEGIGLLSTGRLLRATKDSQALMLGETEARAKGFWEDPESEIEVVLRLKGRKTVRLNGSTLARGSDLLGRNPSVSFSTRDLEIVRGDPASRRAFLDEEMAQTHPAYLRHLTLFRRALEQRNALLRHAQEAHVPAEEFDAWEVPLAEHGAAMRAMRRDWLATLAPLTAAEHSQISRGEPFSATYKASDDSQSAEELREALEGHRAVDIHRGSTSRGPHRDDIDFKIQGRDARLHASQGQQRTAVVAVKLATLEMARNQLGVTPVFLLDDVFSDLDVDRRKHLVARAETLGGQVFLTCTEAELAGEKLKQNACVFRVESGGVVKA